MEGRVYLKLRFLMEVLWPQCISILDCTLPEARTPDCTPSIIYAHPEAERAASARQQRMLLTCPLMCARGSSGPCCKDSDRDTPQPAPPAPTLTCHVLLWAPLQHRWAIQLSCLLGWLHSKEAQERKLHSTSRRSKFLVTAGARVCPAPTVTSTKQGW